MGKKLGIDLGSTYSHVSYVDDAGVVRTVDSMEGGIATPSIVFIDPDSNDVVVGEYAREEGILSPQSVVENVKSYMNEYLFSFNVNGQEYSSAAIASLILKKLVRDAEIILDDNIDGAVITLPAYYADVAHMAYKLAVDNIKLSNGEKLKSLCIVDEPTAAAYAYGSSCNEKEIHKTILLYDLGGASFDISVIKMNFVGDQKDLQIITIDGNHQLGGRDWDVVLADYVRNEFCELTGVDPDEMMNDPKQINWFKENIEKAKFMLTRKESVNLVPSFNEFKELIKITREDFEAITECLLNQTIFLVDDMLDKKGLSMVNDIDEIVLVGGATRMPQVKKRLEEEYNKPVIAYEQEKLIAIGAALIANEGFKDLYIPTPKPSKVANESIGIKANLDGKIQIFNFVLCGEEISNSINTRGFLDFSIGYGDNLVDSITVTLIKSNSRNRFSEINNDCTEWASVKFDLFGGIREDEALGFNYQFDKAGGPSDILELLDSNGKIIDKKSINWKKRAFLRNMD